MPYVMVPVPEEHVREVMATVLRLAARHSHDEPPKGWDQQAVTEFFGRANEPTRGLLSYLAHPKRAGGSHTSRHRGGARARDERGLGPAGAARSRVPETQPRALFESRVHPETSPSGRTLRRRRLMMREENARMVRAADQALREVEPDPLTRRAR